MLEKLVAAYLQWDATGAPESNVGDQDRHPDVLVIEMKGKSLSFLLRTS